jgi:PadR family transcriptional regulator, regulatory protein AphA
MNYSVVTIGDKKYVECVSSEIQLMSDHDTGLLMIHGEVLSEDFFKLSTGVAGAMLQKLVNYQVRTAVIISDELASRGRFGEMVLESNKGSHFRFFSTKEEAENWLINIR